jgi:hypothetical protein
MRFVIGTLLIVMGIVVVGGVLLGTTAASAAQDFIDEKS